MPDRRRHRGAHPEDARLFAEDRLTSMRWAMEEYTWLLSRKYGDRSALKIVGDHHGLTARQRLALWRSACTDEALASREARRVSLAQCATQPLGVDGYNLLITIESALSGGVVLVGRDGCCRDLASVHGTYRKVEETADAVAIIIEHLQAHGIECVDWYLDRPVSNSGRLKAVINDLLACSGRRWNIALIDNPDRVLIDYEGVVVSSDRAVLDRCALWVNLAAELVATRVREAWRVDLRFDVSHGP